MDTKNDEGWGYLLSCYLCTLCTSCLARMLLSLYLVSAAFVNVIPTSLYIIGKCWLYLCILTILAPSLTHASTHQVMLTSTGI